MLTVAAIVVALEVFSTMVSEPAYERAMAFVALLMTLLTEGGRCSGSRSGFTGSDQFRATGEAHEYKDNRGKRIKEIIIHVHRMQG